MPVKIVITPILPKGNYPLDKYEKFEKLLEAYLRGNATRVLRGDFEKTTKGWHSKPSFVAIYSKPYGTRQQLLVMPKGSGTTKWARVSNGTRSRTIRAKSAYGMVFPRYYIPKTTPGGKYGGPGRKWGPEVLTQVVRNHKIEPREFSKKIAKKREKDILNAVTGILRKAFL